MFNAILFIFNCLSLILRASRFCDGFVFSLCFVFLFVVVVVVVVLYFGGGLLVLFMILALLVRKKYFVSLTDIEGMDSYR